MRGKDDRNRKAPYFVAVVGLVVVVVAVVNDDAADHVAVDLPMAVNTSVLLHPRGGSPRHLATLITEQVSAATDMSQIIRLFPLALPVIVSSSHYMYSQCNKCVRSTAEADVSRERRKAARRR